ncbi:ABC transporter substrate-binding protein [Streptomyces sp. NPDC016172]|uniref:ABC transporter substrate-binding protein n=1 Tax=Streptomyces sp. NPDC016172 TaxID=3364964 RepID=UPI0036FD8230
MQVRHQSIKSRRLRFLTALALVPCLAGCFVSPGGESSSEGGPSGARLRVALAFPPAENFSPYGADATLLSRLGVTEGLTALDANGAAAPALARSWRREGERTWRFTLREATFQDGTDVTPAAVASALTHATKAEPAPAALAGVTLSAKADGDTGIRITTAAPDPVLPMRLAGPSLAILSPKAYAKKGTPTPVGTATGPFEITKVNGGGSATLDRFGDYWGGLAHASGIDARFVKDGTARANAVRTGDVDIAEAIPVAQAATLDKETLKEAGTTRTTSLQLNTRTGPFKDPELRAAARSAIDSSALVKGVFEGYADPGAGIFGPAVTWAESKRVKPAGRAKPARADGEPIILATYDNRPELPEVAQVVQQQLRKAGFTVKLEVREYSRLESDALAGKFDAFIGARNSLLDTGDPVGVLGSDYTCDGAYNLARLCDRKVDRAVAEAVKTDGTGDRQGAAMAAEAAILAADAVVPLAHQQIVAGVSTKVRGVLLDPYERTLVGTGTRTRH